MRLKYWANTRFDKAQDGISPDDCAAQHKQRIEPYNGGRVCATIMAHTHNLPAWASCQLLKIRLGLKWRAAKK